MEEIKAELHGKLQLARAGLLSRLDGLAEHDVRRPMTPSGTNLLGLVKHLTGVESGYLGESFGRPLPEPLPWVADDSIYDSADMWARADESRAYVLGLYAEACALADRTVAELPLDALGSVSHWPVERRDTTLGVLLVRVLVDTAQHAGHADVVRELVDGRGGPDADDIGDAAWWAAHLARVRAAADAFPPVAAPRAAPLGDPGADRAPVPDGV